MSEDIDLILDCWKASSGARKITGADGREKVQLRVAVNGHRGILQFNSDGRPDGQRPHGGDFALDHFVGRLKKHVASGRPAEEYRLEHDEAVELIDEAVITYHRYVMMLQLEDYDRVARDTDRNMRLFRFLHRYAGEAEDADALEKWWPYIIRIHHTAKALAAADGDDYGGALAAVNEAGREILALPEQEEPTFELERTRSIQALKELESYFARHVPPERMRLLEDEKLDAIEREDYERAARIRDKIGRLRRKLGDEG